MLLVPVANMAVGPLVGELKCTWPPATGSPAGLFTVTINGEKSVYTAVLCGVPLVAEIVNARDSKAPISTVRFVCRATPRWSVVSGVAKQPPLPEASTTQLSPASIAGEPGKSARV